MLARGLTSPISDWRCFGAIAGAQGTIRRGRSSFVVAVRGRRPGRYGGTIGWRQAPEGQGARKPFVVENISGAGRQTSGATYVSPRGARNGPPRLCSIKSPWAISPSFIPKLEYDPAGFRDLGMVASSGQVLVPGGPTGCEGEFKDFRASQNQTRQALRSASTGLGGLHRTWGAISCSGSRRPAIDSRPCPIGGEPRRRWTTFQAAKRRSPVRLVWRRRRPTSKAGSVGGATAVTNIGPGFETCPDVPTLDEAGALRGSDMTTWNSLSNRAEGHAPADRRGLFEIYAGRPAGSAVPSPALQKGRDSGRSRRKRATGRKAHAGLSAGRKIDFVGGPILKAAKIRGK